MSMQKNKNYKIKNEHKENTFYKKIKCSIVLNTHWSHTLIVACSMFMP